MNKGLSQLKNSFPICFFPEQESDATGSFSVGKAEDAPSLCVEGEHGSVPRVSGGRLSLHSASSSFLSRDTGQMTLRKVPLTQL